MVLGAGLDIYLSQSIDHSFGLPASLDVIVEKLNQAEECKRVLQSQVFCLQQRLQELQDRLQKSKEEAAQNATALRRQVAESQRLLERCEHLSRQCTVLEDECALYLNDRDVFGEVADEAEERAAKATCRAAEAEKKVGEMLMEIAKLKQPESMCKGVDDEQMQEEIARLTSHLTQAESDKASLQNELLVVKADAKKRIDTVYKQIADLEQHNAQIQALLASSNAALEERHSPNGRKRMTRDEFIPSTSCDCLHQAIRMQESTFLSVPEIQNTEAEISRRQERSDFSKKLIQQLMSEIQTLRQEAVLYKSKFEKAEIEVQMLSDDNNELQSTSRKKLSNSMSPNSKGGKNGAPKANARTQGQLLRQPLGPLQSNSVEYRFHHR
eukprot:c15719_g1_i1 orf=310-1458(+)